MVKEIKSSLAQLKVNTAVSFDPETLLLTIDSDDFQIAGATADIIVKID